MLKQKQCRTAEQKGKQQRQAKLSAAVQQAQQQATQAWAAIRADLQACTELELDQRQPCHDALDQWLATATAMTAVIPSGTETVRTDCGPLQEVFAEQTQAVVIAELDFAEEMKQRLSFPLIVQKNKEMLAEVERRYRAVDL